MAAVLMSRSPQGIEAIPVGVQGVADVAQDSHEDDQVCNVNTKSDVGGPHEVLGEADAQAAIEEKDTNLGTTTRQDIEQFTPPYIVPVRNKC